PFDVTAAAHVPASALGAEVGGLDRLGSPREAVTLLRLEGILASAVHRTKALAAELAAFGRVDIVEDGDSLAAWSAVRDVLPFAASGPLGAWPVWRIVCPPASGGALGQRLARETGGEVIYDWGGGLVWAALPPKADALATVVRQRTAAAGGHATLIRASDAVRREVDVFQAQAGGVAALSERLRASFDPQNILNRGRMTRPAT
ncbi:MAG TPA: 2-hydroxy-acid oxidase, partial [Bradyrhizobium sp.]|nr:2-hydroxy-acid oxidase [Bradyrhizobium sp.]